MYLLKNLMPFFEAEGGAGGAAVPESIPGEPAAEVDLMDENDWDTSQSDEENGNHEEGQPEPESKKSRTEKQNAEPIPQMFKVKYNKQEVELTQDQLLEAAQKGMDYDRLREARDRYRTPVERLARQAGMATDQFLNALDGLVKTSAVDVKKENFMSLGMDENQAAYFAEMAYENETLKNGQATQMRQMNERVQARQELQNRISKDIADFEAKFPDVDLLPDEVAAEIKKGESPIVAYQGYLIRENGKKLKAYEQNQKNRQTAAGPVKSIGMETSDPFLDGLLGG